MKFPYFIKSPSAYKTYVASTMTYGLLRKGVEMKNATVMHYDLEMREKVKIPILFCDKALITLICGICSPYFLPMYLYKDLKCLEVSLKNDLNPAWYDVSEKNYISDYLFT